MAGGFFSYVALAVILAVFYGPVTQYLTSAGCEPRRILRTPRPPINESLLAIDTSDKAVTPLSCAPDAYSVHILSKAPLVVYIENFLSADERAHLLEISELLFEPSTITSDGATTQQNRLIRDSEVALIPRTDVVRCIEERAKGVQGWPDDTWIERLRTQRYGSNQHYTHHFDWGSGARGWGRVSSFMVWVLAENVEGGGTEFPRLQRNGPDQPWCRWLECGKDNVKKDGELLTGVTFKPVSGNAVFWENFRPDGSGRGWNETWHAGLPVTTGTKVGLNIWSWGRLN
ncbi:2OG-Fe(II) oxygenase family oxidoreductase [Xylariaceae sp. FL0255]|nr:2OG-Fe(II) oxygenase family oxidoreductase [Xylariaceae sp. FL0255]